MRRLILAAAMLVVLSPARAETLQVFAAGSLTDAIPDLIRRFPAGPDQVATPEFGPSGLMREKIEAGAAVDVFASADMGQARRLAVGHPERSVMLFTRNRLCAMTRAVVGLTTANMLDRLLDPAVRVATSTPGADPGGDYAFAAFARAEAVRAGARGVLETKALKLVGGGAATPLLVPGKGAVEGVFLADRADVVLGYCSGVAGVLAAVPGLVSVELPGSMSVAVAYGMVVLTGKPVALRFAAFVMSEVGQAVLRAHGFDPAGLADGAPGADGLLVQRAGAASGVLRLGEIAAQTPFTQHVSFGSGHGTQSHDFTGPKLWEVLVRAGVVDPLKPAGFVRGIVRVTGADGYVAVLALAELAPEFSGRPIQLATAMDGVALAAPGLRLIVPGEVRGGRSVMDVVRIDVE